MPVIACGAVCLIGSKIRSEPDNSGQISIIVDGNPVTGNPAALPINAHDEIVLIYGVPEPAGSVPTRYDFPSGD
jgi:hypothetical protein